ncbi:uncharacterized protein [Lolium perenne]|uniref:uncharacterized protein isoform X3 n=1 Tax=Lolium perenne TaxID=4522 RepID=UPI003A99B151
MIATTDQIISRLVEPGNIDKIHVEPMHDVNSALFKLQIKDPELPHQTRKDEGKEKFVAEQSYGNSASLDHMLNNGKDVVGLNCDAHTSRVHTDHDLSHKKDEAEDAVNSEFTTPHKLHAMFTGINNMGKENSANLIDNSFGRKSSSIQCGQRTHNYEAQLLSGRNINNELSATNSNPELSSESRIQSYSSHDYDGFENIGIDDFEIDDGRPSLSLRESWLASPRGQVLRHEHLRKLA